MTIIVIEYGGKRRKIEGETFEFRCNRVTNLIKIKKADGSEEIIKDICVIKSEGEEV